MPPSLPFSSKVTSIMLFMLCVSLVTMAEANDRGSHKGKEEGGSRKLEGGKRMEEEREGEMIPCG